MIGRLSFCFLDLVRMCTPSSLLAARLMGAVVSLPYHLCDKRRLFQVDTPVNSLIKVDAVCGSAVLHRTSNHIMVAIFFCFFHSARRAPAARQHIYMQSKKVTLFTHSQLLSINSLIVHIIVKLAE
jgi:hypothetical protein